jgi:hypothetical protein
MALLPIYAFSGFLQHGLSLLGLLSLHQSTGTGFQQRMFLFPSVLKLSNTSAIATPDSLRTELEFKFKSIVM